MNRFTQNETSAHRGQTIRRLGIVAALLVVLALVTAACGSTPEPTALPVVEPTLQPAPTEAPAAEIIVTPSVAVSDQAIVEDSVTIDEVVSGGPGWLVIHAQADGKPGPILGYSPVSDGSNSALVVEIDTSSATEMLYAMLHVDAGEVGSFEFPNGPDIPAMAGDQVVTPAFAVTGGLPVEEAILPSVAVSDQEIVEYSVTIAEVVSDGPGWLVIHAQADGKPGAILGYSPVSDGSNAALKVAIDSSSATETLYAMLHIDAGEVGSFEFPDGPDTPAMAGDQIVTPAFMVSKQAAAAPGAQGIASSELPAGAVVVTGDEAEVEMEDFQFRPKVLVIKPGTTVKFANKDQALHTATSDTGIFDSGYLAKGEEYFYTFTEPGTYPYYCIPHGAPDGVGMAATIIVQP